MENFTPISGLIGGAMIGAAASLFVLLNGRVAGISGILGGLVAADKDDRLWRLAFLAGLVLGPLLVSVVTGAMPVIELQAELPVLVLAGLLVGFGTRLGNGCTSGHGVCGIARGSRRSFVATLVFFSAAALTVFAVRHLWAG